MLVLCRLHNIAQHLAFEEASSCAARSTISAASSKIVCLTYEGLQLSDIERIVVPRFVFSAYLKYNNKKQEIWLFSYWAPLCSQKYLHLENQKSHDYICSFTLILNEMTANSVPWTFTIKNCLNHFQCTLEINKTELVAVLNMEHNSQNRSKLVAKSRCWITKR